MPTTIPAPDRSSLTTPVGVLFNELTHSPAASVMAVVRILENAMDLDAGRYVRGGSSSTILYAIRLACRTESYINYLLAPKAEAVRGLKLLGPPDFGGGDNPNRAQLRNASSTLRRKLMELALPVLQGWYARLRRDSMTRDACTVAAHMAFIYGEHPEVNETEASQVVKEGDAGATGAVDARFTFVMLSTRVYLNVHHDFELEPELALSPSRARRRTAAATVHQTTAAGELGYAPLDVFDLWQRHLHRVLAWLTANPEQASDVMEATVRLLSGKEAAGKNAARLTTRQWESMAAYGCAGRYTPSSGAAGANAKAGTAHRAGWGSEAEAEAAAAAAAGGYTAWLRVVVSAAAETEINVQLGEMTLKRHHMQLLEQGVASHPDFVLVFGDTSARGRHQCAEVKRSQYRRWLRLLGTRHDVQVWSADDRVPPEPKAGLLKGALSPWVNELLEPIRVGVPLLQDPSVSPTLVEVAERYAVFSLLVDGTRKELVLHRYPAHLDVFNVVEHGRRWVRELVYTSDTARCYGDPIAGGGFTGSVAILPRPHWQSGEIATPSAAGPSLVISRAVSPDSPDSQICVPTRHLNGVLPAALISNFLFWRVSDGKTLIGHPMPKPGEPAILPPGLMAADGGGGVGGTGVGGGPSPVAQLAGKDEITVIVANGGSVVRRTPCDANGAPKPAESRRLICTLGNALDSPLGQLVALLERVEDLGHVLMWSAKESETGVASNPFGGGGGGGGDSNAPISLVELPRLHLTFEAAKEKDGSLRLYSKEHPGMYIGGIGGARAETLLRGLPHALVLLNEEGDAHVLLSSLAKPCRLSDPSDPLSSQLILSRASKTWLNALPSVRHLLYGVHRSLAFMMPQSLAACLNLLILKWLARDFATCFALAPSCVTDEVLGADEEQMWLALMALEDDVEPETHAVRLRISLVTRACPHLQPKWDVAKQLALYLAKLSLIPAACQLSANDELILLRAFGASAPGARARVAFLDAALDASLAQDAAAAAAQNNPFASAAPPTPQVALTRTQPRTGPLGCGRASHGRTFPSP